MGYYKREIRSGKVLETLYYYSLRQPGKKFGRGGNWKKTSEAQAVRNYLGAKQKLSRLVNANFSPGDTYISPTYRDDEALPTPAQAKADLKKYLRAIREYGRKTGATIKRVAVTEYREGARPHHHLIMSGIPPETARLLWQTEPDPKCKGKRRPWGNHGRAPNDTLDYSYDWQFLAKYIAKEDKPGEHRWTASRNLTPPDIGEPKEISRAAMTKASRDPKAPKGYRIIGWDYRAGADGNEVLYIRCIEHQKEGTG